MLLPNTTWGQLRRNYLEDIKQGVVTSENPLHDRKIRAESGEHKNEDLVWPEAAKLFNEAVSLDPEVITADEATAASKALTASGEPGEEEPEAEWEPPSPLYFTVAEDGTVLELVKMEDEGLFIRIESKWVDISDEEEFPTVYEQDMHFANDESVGAWDAELEDNDQLKLEDIEDYLI